MSQNKTLDEKKALLKSQIEKLNLLKNETKEKLDAFTQVNENNINNLSFATSISENEISNSLYVNLTIKNELLDFAGIRCIKNTKEEFVFQFIAKGVDHERNVYFVQFFKVNSELELGKWKFPTFLDVNEILEETPTDKINWIYQFLRKSKHYIDCYHHRMNQYIKLKNSMKEYANCSINRDQTYVYISIELSNIYDVKVDNYINIIVYLQYDLKETRPYAITVDSQCGDPLPKETEKDLKSFLKPFKYCDLEKAVETVEYQENPLFSWQRIMKDQTLINDTISKASEQETSMTVKTKGKSMKSKHRSNKTKKPVSSIQKKSSQSKGSEIDIARFFVKNGSKTASNTKNLEKSTQENSSNDSNPSKQKLRRLKSNAKESNFQNKPKKNNKHNISGERRVLRSSTNSPKKDVSPKKNTLKKIIPVKQFVSPKVFHSKKLEKVQKLVSSKTIVSSETSNVKVKQMNLGIQYPDKNAPLTKNPTIKLNYNAKLLRSKVITSTPLPINQKRTRRSLVEDFNISEIKVRKKTQAAKNATKRGIEKPSKVKK